MTWSLKQNKDTSFDLANNISKSSTISSGMLREREEERLRFLDRRKVMTREELKADIVESNLGINEYLNQQRLDLGLVQHGGFDGQNEKDEDEDEDEDKDEDEDEDEDEDKDVDPALLEYAQDDYIKIDEDREGYDEFEIEKDEEEEGYLDYDYDDQREYDADNAPLYE